MCSPTWSPVMLENTLLFTASSVAAIRHLGQRRQQGFRSTLGYFKVAHSAQPSLSLYSHIIFLQSFFIFVALLIYSNLHQFHISFPLLLSLCTNCSCAKCNYIHDFFLKKYNIFQNIQYIIPICHWNYKLKWGIKIGVLTIFSLFILMLGQEYCIQSTSNPN